MNISRLARAIAESPTFALNEEARILRERGEPLPEDTGDQAIRVEVAA